MRNLTSIISIIVVLFTMKMNGQIQTNELPPSFLDAKDKTSDSRYRETLAKPDLLQLAAEDIIEDKIKDLPWRFGYAINVNFDAVNSGEWTTDDNGLDTWKLKIASKDALSLNLNFDDFQLSNNAKLFIYNDDYSDVLGGITVDNNKKDRLFSTRPIKGDQITLELITPTEEKAFNSISINEVVYGYRDVKVKVNKVFQSSGGCNINVNCPDGDAWKEIKRSVAMITSANNTRLCTGTLINNVREDSIPYFLTAAHCGIQNNAIFIFNYESPTCSPNVDGNLSNSISGGSRKAQAANQSSDFSLFQLSSKPPASYNVFYAGWSAVNTPSTKSTCIHHPVGDVKKISVDNNSTTNSGYYSSGVSHWQVSNWESGTTEGGSSGSPLFDQNQRVIGQLHGGDAACGNNSQDYFGKFSYSWDNNSDTLRQLKHWLDPDNTGTTIIDGLDPNPAPFNFDLQAIGINGVESYFCGTSITPIVSVRNIGNSTVNSFFVDYKIGNNPVQSILYNTPIQRNELALVTLPALTTPSGNNTLFASTRIVSTNDQDTSNDSTFFDYQANTATPPEMITIDLRTDSDGSETSWELIDNTTNNVLYKSDPYPDVTGGALYQSTLCLYQNCFTFKLYDSFGDGFNNGRGNGFALITNANNDTLLFENSFNSFQKVDTICVQSTTSIDEQNLRAIKLSVFPNPLRSGESLKLNTKEKYRLRLIQLNGKLIVETIGNSITVPESLAQGVYFLELLDSSSNNRVTVEKVIIQ